MAYANAAERSNLIAGLRALADFMERSAAVPAPCRASVMVFPPYDTDDEMLAEIDDIAAHIGAEIDDKTADPGHYTASRNFGPVEYKAVAIPKRTRAYYDAQKSYSSSIVVSQTDERCER